MLLSPINVRYAAFGLASLSLMGEAGAQGPARTFLDTDNRCRSSGCLVVHNNTFFDIYDAGIEGTNQRVGRGQPLIRRIDNPLAGGRPVGPFITDTLIPADQITSTQTLDSFGFDINNDGQVDVSSQTDTNGFLDIEDTFSTVILTAETRLIASSGLGLEAGRSPVSSGEGEFRRSFFVSSRRTGANLTARVIVRSGDPSLLNTIPFAYSVATSGVNAGVPFGEDARANAAFIPSPVPTTLGDLVAGPVTLVQFRGGIRQRSSDTIADQSFRFDYVFGNTDYDLSVGPSNLDFAIEFNFVRR